VAVCATHLVGTRNRLDAALPGRIRRRQAAFKRLLPPGVEPVFADLCDSAAVVAALTVRYDGARPDWAAPLSRRLSGQKLTDFQRSYGFLAKRSTPTSQADVAATTRLLGRPPRRYETYVRETAGAWSLEQRPR
jgi:hypothetical protein